MSLIHGKAIGAEEVERIVSRQFSPEQFASLCNAITWASSGQQCLSLPSFTERVNVADGGIDAELAVELSPDIPVVSPLIGGGWTVFQYKKRDITARDRDNTFSGLKGSVKHAVKEIWERTTRRPNRYVLFTNLDLTHLTKADNAGNPQKGELKASILDGYDQPESVHVEIVGAAELAALLNNHPHLRSTYFSTSQFETWQRFAARHYVQRQNVFGAKVDMLGRDALLGQLRGLVDSSSVKVIILYGPHTIGKTRLAIEATVHHPIETIAALDPLSITLSDLAALASTGVEIVVIIEGPDSAIAEKLIEYVISIEGIKLIVTLPTSEKAPTLNYGRDTRVQLIPVGPLDDENAEKLIRASGPKIDYSLQSWIIQQAGGNPGVLLWAANLGKELRQTSSQFSGQVSAAFEQKVRNQLGEEALKVLGLLSILTHVGIRGNALAELEAICSLFGNGVDPNTVLNIIPKLREAGLVVVGGSYVEVVPQIFANALAASTLRGRFSELCSLLAVLGRNGAIRLLRRLRGLRIEEVEKFWEELFGTDGLFRDFDSSLSSGYLLRLIAGSVPDKVARLIEPALDAMTVEQRLAIKDDQRRELVWTIEELLYRRRTSKSALKCMSLLAEAESELGISNNATGVFADCFHSWHPQFPMLLMDRIAFLKSLLDASQPARRKILAVTAVTAGLGRVGSGLMRQSDGAEPLDSAPFMTNGDVWMYTATLVDMIIDGAVSDDAELSKVATEKLPRALMEAAPNMTPQAVVSSFKRAIDLVVVKKVSFSINELIRALNNFLEDLLDWKKTLTGEKVHEVEGYLSQTQELLRALETGDFETRLKKWVGGWSHDLVEFEIDDGQEKMKVYRHDKELFDLARQVIANPQLLTDEIISWLTHPRTHHGRGFFYWLGLLDRTRHWQSKFEILGTKEEGKMAFAAYFGGRARRESAFVSGRLDELAIEGSILPEAIISATTSIEADSAAIRRAVHLLQHKRIDPTFVAQVFSTGWLKTLSQEDFLKLVMAVAGEDLAGAGCIFDMYSMWIHCGQPVEGELAEFGWRCLEAAPPVTANDEYDCNQLAIKLAPMDIDRAFKLVNTLLRQPYNRKSWNPVDRYGAKDFWEYLHMTDRRRLLLTVLEYGLEVRLSLIDISWHLSER